MKKYYGKTTDGQDVYLYTIENDNIVLSVTDYGATLVSCVVKSVNKDVVTGFDNMQGLLSQTSYMGASIGRTANRIARGEFILNGEKYYVPINNNGNANHGGIIGFDKVIWDIEEAIDRVTFHYLSKDGEEGYPGNLDVYVTYSLLSDGFEICAKGTPDKDTLFAYTNHAYFNLDESDDVLDHEVRIFSDEYVPCDVNTLALDKTASVRNTPFDFTEYKALGKDINIDNMQLSYGKGYDHFYPIPGKGMRLMARVKAKELEMSVESDQPGMHLYSGNWLEGKTGKKGHIYGERSACAFECAYRPNTINYPDVEPKPIVKANTTSTQTIRYTFKRL